MDFSDVVLFMLLLAVILSTLFEAGLLVYAYTHADKVKCNLLWCTFTKTNSISSIDSSDYLSNYTSSSSDRQCYVNGKKVNCSLVDKEIQNFIP